VISVKRDAITTAQPDVEGRVISSENNKMDMINVEYISLS
jgi:hypothetical protein